MLFNLFLIGKASNPILSLQRDIIWIIVLVKLIEMKVTVASLLNLNDVPEGLLVTPYKKNKKTKNKTKKTKCKQKNKIKQFIA